MLSIMSTTAEQRNQKRKEVVEWLEVQPNRASGSCMT